MCREFSLVPTFSDSCINTKVLLVHNDDNAITNFFSIEKFENICIAFHSHYLLITYGYIKII